MILILSCNGDLSTELVMDWLISKKHPFFRLNSSDFIEKDFFYDINKNIISIGNKILNLDDINSVWFRKFGFFKNTNYYENAKTIINKDYLPLLSIEFNTMLIAFWNTLREKNWVTNPKNINLNKIEVLRCAKKLGLEIPKTFLLNNKKYLENVGMSLITKSVAEVSFMYEPEGMYSMYTKEILTDRVYNYVPTKFFPSLVQEKIDKEYELRIFYLENKFYPMVIFSQLDEKTKIDFRQYNDVKPNQNAPYKLPKNIEKSLKNLVKMFCFNCCSIDMIKDVNGIYYFLEINPVGQFGMVSDPCNYHLNRLVAEYLIKLDK